ncbi:MAG: DUF4249 domain-containing protein [Muribaculaceae bacterium]|nr:DUF4249 domain-containing protein [Muribaculaceae bacterium]
MKTQIIFNIAATLILCMATSCETFLPDPATQAKDDIQVVASSLVTTGDTVSVRLAYTENFTDKITEVYYDRNMMLRALMFPDTTRHSTDKYLMKKYYDELLLRVGKVELVTGTGERKEMKFNPSTFNFECAHKPTPGERLELSANISSRTGKSLSLHSSTVVPGWKPEAEIIEATRLYREGEEREDLGLREMTNDSVYQLKILLKDKSRDTHCYRIKVQGVSYQYEGDSSSWNISSSLWAPPIIVYMPDDYVTWTEAFFTTDPLLYDANLKKSFGAWHAYTTDLFTNKQFKNGSYLLTVQSRYPYTSPGEFNKRRYIQVQLEPISFDLMNYLSTLYRVRIAETGYFSEPQSLASNINGGVGIFGSIGEPLVLRYWFPGEEDPNYPM